MKSSTLLITDSQILEQRRQQALKVAQQCINLLKQDFGATEVILFGSLRMVSLSIELNEFIGQPK